MLAIVTPAGFDEFIAQAGVPAVAGQTPPKPGLDELARIKAAAPEFGVELRPDIDW